MEEINSPVVNLDEVSRIESIINTKSFTKNQLDLYFLIDYLQGFTYINNQIQYYSGDSSIIKNLFPFLQVKSHQKGDIIYKKGQRNEYIYFIIQGKVSQWKAKSKEDTDYERNIINQIKRLQKLIDNETQLILNQKYYQMNSMIKTWELQLESFKKQITTIQKEDRGLIPQFISQEGIATLSFEKIYYSKIDIFGNQNTLYNTRPINTIITETDTKFLTIKGDEFYKIFKKEVQNIKFLLKCLYSQFNTIDRTILQALAQYFTSYSYNLNQEICSINPITEQAKFGKLSAINQASFNENQIGFYIIKAGTVLVKETTDSTNYNICQLNQESLLGIEKLSPSYKIDFADSNISFICMSNRLQLLGISRSSIEEVQQTHQNNEILKILAQLGQQRCQFIIHRRTQIQTSLNPFQSNQTNISYDQISNNSQKLDQKQLDNNQKTSKYGFVNQFQQIQNKISANDNQDEDSLMIKSCQKNQKQQLSFKVEIDEQINPVHLKSIVNNLLKFRPSKMRTEEQMLKRSNNNNNNNRLRRTKQDTNNIKIQDTLIVNSESESHHKKSTKLKSYISQNNSPTQSSLQIDRNLKNSSIANSSDQILIQQNYLERKNNQKLSILENNAEDILIQRDSKKKCKSSILKVLKACKLLKDTTSDKKNSKQFSTQHQSPLIDNFNTSSEEDSCQDDDHQSRGDVNCEKFYERFYRQSSLKDSDDCQNKIKKNHLQRKSAKRISNLQSQQYQTQESQKKMKINTDSNSLVKTDLDIQSSITTTPRKRINKHHLQITSNKKLSHQQSSPKLIHPTEELRDDKITQKKLIIKRQLFNKSLDNSSLNQSRTNYSVHSQAINSNLKAKKQQTLSQDQFLALEFKLSKDFEVKNGKLISKKPPTFSELREDFISSQNPYQQCTDLIEKFQMISDSNKDFIQKNSQDYKKELQKQVDEQKRIIRIIRQKKKSDDTEGKIKHPYKSKLQDTSQKVLNIETLQNSFRNQSYQESPQMSKLKPNLNDLNKSPKQDIHKQSPMFFKEQNQQNVGISRQSSFNPNDTFDSVDNNIKQQININNSQNLQNYPQQINPFRVNPPNSIFKNLGAMAKYLNQSSHTQQKSQQLFTEVNTSNFQQNQSDSSLIMIRSLSVASKDQTSRPNSAQINSFYLQKPQNDLGVNIMNLKNIDNLFQPQNFQVQMMPSFEPKLLMNSVNRPKTANTHKIIKIFEKQNDEIKKNGNSAHQIIPYRKEELLNFVKINNQQNLNLSLSCKQQQLSGQNQHQFKLSNYFPK